MALDFTTRFLYVSLSPRRQAVAYLLRTKFATFLTTSMALLAFFALFDPTPAAAQTHKAAIQVVAGPSLITVGAVSSLSLLTNNLPPNTYLETLIYPRLPSRSALQYLKAYGVSGYPLGSSVPLEVSHLVRTQGVFTLPFLISSSLSSSSSPANSISIDLPGCSQGCDGVYPVVIAAISDGATIATKVVPMAILTASEPAVVPLGIAFSIDASNLLPKQLGTILPGLANTANAFAQQALTIKLSASSVVEASQSSSNTIRTALHQLIAWSQRPGHQLQVTDVVPVKLNLITASGLGDYLTSELAFARATSRSSLTSQITKNDIYLTTSSLNSPALKILGQSGFSRLIVTAAAVNQPNLKYTLTSGLKLLAPNGLAFETLVLDPQLIQDLQSGTTTYESSNLAVADMVQVFEDQPNDSNPRVLALNVPGDSQSQLLVAQSLLQAISGSQVLRTYSDATAFDTLEADSAPSEWPTTSIVHSSAKSLSQARQFKKTFSLLTSFDGSTTDVPLVNQLRLELYSSLADNISETTSRRLINGVSNSINSIFAGVALPHNRVVTLTSTRATIPIAVTSREKVPLKLRLTLKSDRLRIEGGQSQLLTVGSATNTASFIIDTKTLGIFQANLTLTTPDGKVAISSTALQIRSLTFTLAGTILTAIALAILGLWWLRTLRKGRARNSKLVPKNPETVANVQT